MILVIVSDNIICIYMLFYTLYRILLYNYIINVILMYILYSKLYFNCKLLYKI